MVNLLRLFVSHLVYCILSSKIDSIFSTRCQDYIKFIHESFYITHSYPASSYSLSTKPPISRGLFYLGTITLFVNEASITV